MELTNLVTLNVQCFHDRTPSLQVMCRADDNGQVSSSDVHGKVCQELGLKSESESCFALVCGMERPIRKYNSTDQIPSDANLGFVKWTFCCPDEKRLYLDQEALYLIKCQAQAEIASGLRMKVSSAQLAELRDCLDPQFQTHLQYMNICHIIRHYMAVMCHNCEINRQGSTGLPSMLDNHSHVDIHISKNGIAFKAGGLYYGLHWTRLKQWSSDMKNSTIILCFTHSVGSSCSIQLHSNQVEYIISVMGEFIKISQGSDGPKFYADMRRKSAVGMEYDNALYDPSKPVRLDQGFIDIASA